MQTTDPYGGWTPPTGPSHPDATGGSDEPPRRVLRRSRTDRVGAGVAGGLGEYFGVDPVLFRVVFATAAFFGGVGIIAYLLAWAAIPEQGTRRAAVDGWIAALRRRHVPVWLVAVVAALIFWGIGFSWWAPRPLIPLMIVAIIVVVAMSRRERTRSAGRAGPPSPPAAAVDLNKGGPVEEPTPGDTVRLNEDTARPEWLDETRHWFAEAKEMSRMRRRRARPVLVTTMSVLAATLGVLALSDVVGGIVLPTYFWVLGGIVVLGLIVGLILRRTPWSMALLLGPAVAGLIAFGGSHASLHDGIGQREWTPTATLQSGYRLGIGQGVLDLRHLPPLSGPQTVTITLGVGQAKLVLPPSMNATINADVHAGQIEVDGDAIPDTHDGRHDSGGYNLQHVILPPTDAAGPHVQINIHVTDGQINIHRAG